MHVFRDLSIVADAGQMATAVADMEQKMPAGWARDKDAEARTRAFPSIAKRVNYCFTCTEDKQRPSATLIIAQKDARTFYISNIIPRERHQLERAEYNSVFNDFFERVFKPYAEKSKIEYSVTEAEAGPESWMDERTAELLRAFSSNANKGTGASHPSDRERWNLFVLAAHRTNCKLDASTLARWLVEEQQWSPEIAEQLALEYESGRELLEYADSR